jgi:hypothetical protein
VETGKNKDAGEALQSAVRLFAQAHQPSDDADETERRTERYVRRLFRVRQASRLRSEDHATRQGVEVGQTLLWRSPGCRRRNFCVNRPSRPGCAAEWTRSGALRERGLAEVRRSQLPDSAIQKPSGSNRRRQVNAATREDLATERAPRRRTLSESLNLRSRDRTPPREPSGRCWAHCAARIKTTDRLLAPGPR